MMKVLKSKYKDILTVDPNIRGGIPCFKNTDIPVSLVITHIAKGWTLNDLNVIFPQVKTSFIEILLNNLSDCFINGKEENQTGIFNCR